MKILGVSDYEVNILYSAQITSQYYDVDLILSCGDLPTYYLEYIVTMLNKPFYFIHGNHYYGPLPLSPPGQVSLWTQSNLHRRVVENKGILIAGIEGSIRYSTGPYQYSQEEMWANVFHLVPQFLMNKIRTGRFVDIFISHAPPWGIHDKEDLPHHGIKAFQWLLKVFRPRLHLHGHIHLFNQNDARDTRIYKTRVVNVYGYQIVTLAESSGV